MSDSMDVTRRQLRAYLIPATHPLHIGQDDDGDHFPRSKVMRFAFNPGNRRLLAFSGSILALVATRVVGREGIGMLAGIARSLTRNNKR